MTRVEEFYTAQDSAENAASNATPQMRAMALELEALRRDSADQIARRDAALSKQAQEAEAAEKIRRDLEATIIRQRAELLILTEQVDRLKNAPTPAVNGRTEPPSDEPPSTEQPSTGRPGLPWRLRSLAQGFGHRDGQNPSLKKQIEALHQSPLFDRNWYAETYRDCGGADKAAAHYIREGAFIGHDPSPSFSTFAYYKRNPDVAETDWAALSHYLFYGKAEGRSFEPF